MMDRKGFYFMKSFFEAAEALPNKEDRADFYDAVCTYALTGEEPEVSGIARALFLLAKPNIDASIKKAEAGARGGSKKKADVKDVESKTEANDKQTASKEEASSENPEAIKDKGVMSNDKGVKDKGVVKKETKKESTPEPFASEFHDFWEIYPRKVAKDKAYTAFVKAMQSGVDIGTILDAVAKQKKSQQWTKDGGQFIPHPTTWINQKRWMDELVVPEGGATFEEVFEEAF